MFLGLTIEKLVVLAVLVAFVLGPERLPTYAAVLARQVRRLKGFASSAKDRLRDEVGDDVDWRELDPRRYDPRRIIRDALLDDPPKDTTPQ